MIFIAKWTIIAFALFFMYAGLLMLLAPEKASRIISKAGSTNFINYAEISIRMIPATALILYSEFSRAPEIFKIFGWFMLITSLILFFVPRRIHHQFSKKSADILKPLHFRLISPFAFLIGIALIYCVI